ncbi:MAG: IS200/IS605 family transposase [Candidatus Competibacteraceae bacterium]|nr:IS200/IS605 family transposase [Candidatus Competibacteraceae bacterium]MBK8896689.1 IS200/IS605 family transposase [Candidatus Competibacteraceae bacterium]MBK8897377.1 IS200/IS605 family transposase [Candidatus Competibacteraceae bacterium]
MQDELRRGRHVVYRIHAHLVFVPRYRRKVFDRDALERLRATFAAVCEDFGATLDEFNGEVDHVHLLVHYPPKVAVSGLVNSLKGVSARRLRQDRPDLAKRYWSGGLWSASYFAASCGGAPIDVLRQYIEQQRAPNE